MPRHARLGDSSHARSQARVTGRSVDPRERLPYHTVADNGCTNCHKIHSADHPERLLRFRREEQNCLNCHNGSVAQSNIASDLRKVSAHPVHLYTGVHDPTEDPRTMPRHVECADCHNPHAAAPERVGRPGEPSLGLATGSLRFVSGVNRVGRPVERAAAEYEVCFKCHADGSRRPLRAEVSRQITRPTPASSSRRKTPRSTRSSARATTATWSACGRPGASAR
jgi:predicted CXXCH cytochrome family protein